MIPNKATKLQIKRYIPKQCGVDDFEQFLALKIHFKMIDK